METKYLITALLVMILFTNCSSEADGSTLIAKSEIWSLTHVNGGVAGVDDNFVDDAVTWNLKVADNILVVKNDYEGENLYSGPKSGNYPYTIKTLTDGTNLMIIGGEEFGQLTLSEKEAVLDQNVSSNGTGADGFILSFKR